MGNTHTNPNALADYTAPPRFPASTFGLHPFEVPKEGWFMIERILAPDIRVGLVSGSGAQGICLADGKIRRLQTFESTSDELNYTFEGATSLKVYRCGTTNVCYDLSTLSLNVSNAHRERIPMKFKPISMGDSTKEIDAIADLFKPWN